jgi:Lon protease-like protein
MTRSRFTGELEPARQGGALVRLPAEVVAALGGTRVRVLGTLNGVPFRSSTMPSGGENACLGVHKATREAAAAGFGDRVEVEIERDDAPRQVTVPADLAAALAADAQLQAAFDRLASAKRAETRARRVAATLDRLKDSAGS